MATHTQHRELTFAVSTAIDGHTFAVPLTVIPTLNPPNVELVTENPGTTYCVVIPTLKRIELETREAGWKREYMLDVGILKKLEPADDEFDWLDLHYQVQEFVEELEITAPRCEQTILNGEREFDAYNLETRQQQNVFAAVNVFAFHIEE